MELLAYWARMDGAALRGVVGSVKSEDGLSDRDREVERFARLLARCQRRLFVYAMSLLHDPNDAEDVLQETNIVLWKKFNKYERGTDFAAWACRIARFEILKVYKKKGRSERLFSDKFMETLADGCDRSMRQWDDRQDALGDCVGKLPDRDRDLVRSRYQPGATTRSVAEAFERSVQGTRKSLLRIRNSLLECVRRTLSSRDRP